MEDGKVEVEHTSQASNVEPVTEKRPHTPPVPPAQEGSKETEANAETSQSATVTVLEEEWQPPVSQLEDSKWKEMIDGIGVARYMRQHPDRFRRRVRRGIPPQYRWEVWKAAVELKKHDKILALDYKSLSTRENQWTNVIEIDIARTFPELKSFGQDHQKQLWRVLNAYASYNPTLGYCQGMNFVAGLLLLVSKFHEEESFRVLVCLMDHVGLVGFYGEKLPLFRRYLRACDKLVKETVPDLQDHFKKENVNAPVYLHQWFLTLFINCFPLSMVTIIWDVIICEGLEVVLRIAVSILQVLKDSLLAMQFEEIIRFFKMMKTYNDEDGELNAFRIGQLLMKHTELVKVPQNILDELRNDTFDDDLTFEFEECMEGDGINNGTWFPGFTRVFSMTGSFSMFGYGSTKKRSSGSDASTATSSHSAGGWGSPKGIGTSSNHHGDRDAEPEVLARDWEFL